MRSLSVHVVARRGMDPVRFLCDGMLGSLARWLRVLGFDAAFAGSQASDDEVMERARREGRTIATRDLELTQRCIKARLPAILLRDLSVEEQLLILLTHTGAELDPARFLTRCTECGAVLEAVEKSAVAEKVPPAVLEEHEKFWKCPDCGHVYWQGSHVSAIETRILDLARRLAGE